MSEKDEKTQKIPTYAPDKNEQEGVPSTPETYPLFKKMDAIKGSIDALTTEVKNAVTALKNLSATIPASVLASANKVAPQTNPEEGQDKPSKLEEVTMAFSEDLEALLYFEDKDDYIIIKPRQFLGSENFAKIASAVRGLGGEYISAGKDSHFRVSNKN